MADATIATARPTGAKILATLGPASDSEAVIRQLVLAGVSAFRLNFSHGTFEEHEVRLGRVRSVADDLGLPIAVLGDLQGPKIRVGKIPEGIELQAGQDVLFGNDPNAGAPTGTLVLPCTYTQLGEDVAPGHRVLINDGLLRLLAIDPEPADPVGLLRARVVLGGLVTSGKGINLPDSRVRAPAITERDWECVEWAVKAGLDFLALSFVRDAAEVRSLRDALAGMCSIDGSTAGAGEGAMIPVIAKIEKPEAVANIEEILEVADGIMVARGDLGVEIDLARVPIVQKRLLEVADEWGKPCIVATQMLETMIERSIPTRAEATDVSTAIFEGADVVMLSGETAVGHHPSLVVETMRRIIETTESRMAETPREPSPPGRALEARYRTAALAHGAWHVVHDLDAQLVVVWSERGGSARYLSQTGMGIPIIAYSSDARQTRRMALLRGVTALHMPVPEDGSLAAWNRSVDDEMIARGWAQRGDPVVMVAGRPLGRSGSPNVLAIHYIGNEHTGFRTHD